jgi:hypothetical protein
MSKKSKPQLLCAALVFFSLLAGTSLVSMEDAFAFRRHDKGVQRHHARHRGRAIKRLPVGHKTVLVGGVKYFYHGGIFYEGGPFGFFVVTAPVGAVVVSIPVGFKTVVVEDTTYYYYNGVYYRRVPSGYVVEEPPSEVVVVREASPAAQLTAKAGDRVTVTAQRLNVRSGPGLNFGVVFIVNRGETLTVKGNAPGWLFVKLPSETFGWVDQKYVAPVVQPTSGVVQPASG